MAGTRPIGFHAQQVVEKMLKAWLDVMQFSYPRIHQIDLRLTYLRDAGMDVAAHCETRYPCGPPFLRLFTPFRRAFRPWSTDIQKGSAPLYLVTHYKYHYHAVLSCVSPEYTPLDPHYPPGISLDNVTSSYPDGG